MLQSKVRNSLVGGRKLRKKFNDKHSKRHQYMSRRPVGAWSAGRRTATADDEQFFTGSRLIQRAGEPDESDFLDPPMLFRPRPITPLGGAGGAGGADGAGDAAAGAVTRRRSSVTLRKRDAYPAAHMPTIEHEYQVALFKLKHEADEKANAPPDTGQAKRQRRRSSVHDPSYGVRLPRLTAAQKAALPAFSLPCARIQARYEELKLCFRDEAPPRPPTVIQHVFGDFVNAHKKALKKVFVAIDADGDGEITAAEFRKGLADMGLSLTSEEVALTFDVINTDDDDSITLPELKAYIRENQKNSRRPAHESFPVMGSSQWLTVGMPKKLVQNKKARGQGGRRASQQKAATMAAAKESAEAGKSAKLLAQRAAKKEDKLAEQARVAMTAHVKIEDVL